jgi:hypothetical protein
MAKTSTSSIKVTFGKRKEGSHSKGTKPKQSKKKKYRGQGR